MKRYGPLDDPSVCTNSLLVIIVNKINNNTPVEEVMLGGFLYKLISFLLNFLLIICN